MHLCWKVRTLRVVVVVGGGGVVVVVIVVTVAVAATVVAVFTVVVRSRQRVPECDQTQVREFQLA